MMNLLRLISVVLLFVTSYLVSAKEARELDWEELMPAGYLQSLLEPKAATDSMFDQPMFEDDTSVEAQAAYAELQTKLRAAPIVDGLNNEYVKLAGFVVPLSFDFDTETFSSFLLVPYFGACIHVPPPPANQIVYVDTKKELNQELLDYAVWVTGTLQTESKDSEFGFAGYTINDPVIEPYEE